MKYFLSFILFFYALSIDAQIVTPQPSPVCKLEQKFGLGSVTIEYSRPSMKNRVVFGDLVPYGKLWRTGANKASKITFTDDVTIEGKLLPKGSYALYTIPGDMSWDVIFYSDADQPGGLPKTYDISKEALKVQAIPELLTTTIETFTIDINDIRNDAANLVIQWENTSVSVRIKTEIDSKIVQNIDKVLAGPSAGDYYSAARYYFDSGKDLNQALSWIQKSNNMEAQFWKLRLESLILAKLERREEAIEVAKKSLAMAAAAGNDDYVKMNNQSIEEWSRK
jgi:hypothetical protein